MDLIGWYAQNVEILKPAIMCQIPQRAAIKAIPPKPLNKFGLKIKTKANPEF